MVVAFSAVKSTDVYADSLARARANDDVKQTLGEPIEPAWMVVGAVQLQNGNGTAELAIPLSGPKGSGVLQASARKANNGPWQYSKMEVTIPGGRVIDLRNDIKK